MLNLALNRHRKNGIDKHILINFRVKKVLFCSGKHYYALQQKRASLKADDVAIVRVEELSPFPAKEVGDELEKFTNAKDVIWSQEEPRNMGAWSFVSPRFENLFGVKVRQLSFLKDVKSCLGFSKRLWIWRRFFVFLESNNHYMHCIKLPVAIISRVIIHYLFMIYFSSFYS